MQDLFTIIVAKDYFGYWIKLWFLYTRKSLVYTEIDVFHLGHNGLNIFIKKMLKPKELVLMCNIVLQNFA